MKLVILSIAAYLLLALMGCGKYYSSQSYLKTSSPITHQILTIDNTYTYYIRQLYKCTIGGVESQRSYRNLMGATGSLLEVEYLFISRAHNNVIYISTMADKYESYYSDPTRYLGENFINLYDLKRISFGRLISPNSIEYTTKDLNETNVWNITSSSIGGENFIILNTVEKNVRGSFIDLISVNRALQNDVSFKEVSAFTLGFYRSKPAPIIRANSNMNIYIDRQKGKYDISFQLSANIIAGGNTIHFDNDRVPYTHTTLTTLH